MVGKKGERMRSKRFAHSVALGPRYNQVGTNLRSTHAVPMSHVMIGGNQVQVLLLDSPILNKRTFTELSKWLDQSSKASKAISAYLLECQVEVSSQLFKAHYQNVPLYKPGYVDLNNDLKSESKHKLTTWREKQREEESLCVDASTVAGHTKDGLAVSDGEILKNKGDSAKFKKMLIF